MNVQNIFLDFLWPYVNVLKVFEIFDSIIIIVLIKINENQKVPSLISMHNNPPTH